MQLCLQDISYIVSSVDPEFSRPFVTYRGRDAAETFVRKIRLEAD